MCMSLSNFTSRLLFLGCILFLQACATSAQKTAGMRNSMLNNQIEHALKAAETKLNSEPDGVMENMNVGTLRQLIRDYEGSNQAFDVAKRRIEALYSTSITEQAGAAVINDETISFQGDKFEQILVHMYMAMNYINLGQPDSARVELLQSQVKMDEWGEPGDESPFMRYFSGIVFEMLGEEDTATVSYRKAVDAYSNTFEKHGLSTPRQLQSDLLRMLATMGLWDEYKSYKKQFELSQYKPLSSKGKGELVVIIGNGLVPQRQQKVFQTWAPTLALNVRVAVPDYPYPARTLNRMRINIAGKSYPLNTVSNLDGMAKAALSENMATITTRAVARAVIKKKSEKDAGEQGGFLGQLALMVLNQSTEIADTRCWNTLPQSFELSRVLLPPGEYPLEIEVVSPTGFVIDRMNNNVKIVAGAKSFITRHWTTPGATRKH